MRLWCRKDLPPLGGQPGSHTCFVFRDGEVWLLKFKLPGYGLKLLWTLVHKPLGTFLWTQEKRGEKQNKETFYPAAKKMNSSCCRPSSPPPLSQPQRGERLIERQSAGYPDLSHQRSHAASFTTNSCPSVSPGAGLPAFSSSAKLKATRSNCRYKHSPVFVCFFKYTLKRNWNNLQQNGPMKK